MALTAEQDADVRTLHIRQGVSYRAVFTWLDADDAPMDLTGLSALFELVTKPGRTILVSVVSPDSMLGGVTIDVPTGKLTVHLNAEQTAGLSKDGNYALRVVADDDPLEVETVQEGFFNLLLTGEAYPFPAIEV